MTEHEFFGHLEMRLCRELSGMRSKELRGWWCDGFIPGAFEVAGDQSRIIGRVWLEGSGSQTCWDFVLLLGYGRLNREKIGWATLIPGEDVTGWLSMDFDSKTLTINPAPAHPDGKPCELRRF